jgi:HAD superfamily hydrolase (TIGR01549 family)
MPNAPRALLLDFGGVIVDDDRRPNSSWEIAEMVHQAVASVDGALSVPAIEVDLVAGMVAYGSWGNGSARWAAPPEISHEQLWVDFIAADWPGPAREAVGARATELTYRMGELTQEWRLRTGMAELLADAARLGIPVAVVSNTIYGRVHREFLAAAGLTDRFAVQIYSDEAGVRKPNPEMVRLACRALSVEPSDTWFVGDTRSRDVLCGRRAGVGLMALMTSPRTGREPAVTAEPDVEVPDPVALHALLTEAVTAG